MTANQNVDVKLTIHLYTCLYIIYSYCVYIFKYTMLINIKEKLLIHGKIFPHFVIFTKKNI